MPSRIKGHTRKIIGGAQATAKETYKNLFKKCENMSQSNCNGSINCAWRPKWVEKDGKHEKSKTEGSCETKKGTDGKDALNAAGKKIKSAGNWVKSPFVTLYNVISIGYDGPIDLIKKEIIFVPILIYLGMQKGDKKTFSLVFFASDTTKPISGKSSSPSPNAKKSKKSAKKSVKKSLKQSANKSVKKSVKKSLKTSVKKSLKKSV